MRRRTYLAIAAGAVGSHVLDFDPDDDEEEKKDPQYTAPEQTPVLTDDDTPYQETATPTEATETPTETRTPTEEPTETPTDTPTETPTDTGPEAVSYTELPRGLSSDLQDAKLDLRLAVKNYNSQYGSVTDLAFKPHEEDIAVYEHPDKNNTYTIDVSATAADGRTDGLCEGVAHMIAYTIDDFAEYSSRTQSGSDPALEHVEYQVENEHGTDTYISFDAGELKAMQGYDDNVSNDDLNDMYRKVRRESGHC